MKLLIANKRYSSWSLRGWLAARMTGVALEVEMVPLRQSDTEARIRALSPSGKVPALQDGDIAVWDSLAILEYLAETFPDAGLWPSDRRARAVARSISAEMHSGFQALRWDFTMNLGRVGRPIAHSDEADADVRRIDEIWRTTRAAFGAEGPFLFGRFSGADCMYAPVATRFVSYAIPVSPEAQAYVDAVMAHPLMVEWRADAERETERIAEYEWD